MPIRPAAFVSAALLLAACGSPSGGDAPADVPEVDVAAPQSLPEPEPGPAPAPDPAVVHEAALAAKGARVTDRGLWIGLDSADFPVGGTDFEPASDERIAHAAGLLRARPDLRVEVLGYTDDRGSPEVNRQVSAQRAGSVRDWLVEREGIDPGRIAVSGLGAADPIASNESADGRALNRRVELLITDGTGGFPSRLAEGPGNRQ